MGGFASFVKKEALHILRDKRTMLIVLIVPVIQIILFGFAISTEVRNIDVAFSAPRVSEVIRQAAGRIDANEYFTFKGMVAQTDIDRTLRMGDADVVVVFADDFQRRAVMPDGKPALQLVVDAANPNQATAAMAYLQNVLAGSGQSGLNARLLYNPQMKSAYNFVPGIMGLIFILICAMMTAVSIVREKELGTMEVLLVSPVRPLRIILAKMLPYFALSCFNLLSILLLARYLLGVPMSGSIGGLVLLSLLYIFLSLALGLLISTLADTQVVAMLISGMLMMMPIIMLSGMVFPIENMPHILQGVSCIIPARWYIEGVRKLMIEGQPLVMVLRELGILTLMTLVLVVIALRNFKNRLE